MVSFRNYLKIALVGGVGAVLFIFFFHPFLAQELTKLGNTYFGGALSYNLNRADFLYSAALFIHPGNLHASHQRARIAFLRGDFDNALALINKQIELHNTSFMASYYIRGLIHGYRKEYIEAERDFKTFLTWDPQNWAALNDLAWVYFAQGKFKEAEEASYRGLKIAPTNPWLLTMHGMSLFNQNGIAEATKDLEKARRYAADLTEEDWIRAYPGNNPLIASSGLVSLRAAIEENWAHVNRRAASSEDVLY
jgi:tetratricopeptide (TPR) repeat protein